LIGLEANEGEARDIVGTGEALEVCTGAGTPEIFAGSVCGIKEGDE